MGKKLTQHEKENKTIQKIIRKIKRIEQHYGINPTRKACQQYANKKRKEQHLEREIREREKELERLKKVAEKKI